MLVEDDPASFDPAFWTEMMRATRSNAACISAGGYVAFYPTQIPFHHRSRELGSRDVFGDLVDRARSLGMSVMARVDPHAVHADAAEAHPEWLARLADGTPQQHPDFADAWITCPFGDYNREFLTEIAREIVRGYDVDAVFANRWTGHGISYSEAARRAFFDATGFDLPQKEGDLADPAWLAYETWRRARFSELVAHWDDAVRAIRPHVRFIPNLTGEFGPSYFDRHLIDEHYPFFVLDKQSRAEIEAPWVAGRVGKRNRAIVRDRPIALLSSIGPESRYRWKDAVLPGPEIQTWIVDGFAHGAAPWFIKFNGKVPDQRWTRPVIEAFELHARLEPVLSELDNVADVALFEPVRTARPLPGTPDPYLHETGVYQALVEARIPFEIVSGAALSAVDLARFKVLVLASADRMSDEQADIIRAFVADGGGIVAAHETSHYDEAGALRKDFALADVLGASVAGPGETFVQNNYIALTAPGHPTNDGFDGAERIVGGTELLEVAARPGSEVAFRFLPHIPNLPMEELYARSGPVDPAVILNRYGAGRSAYAAFDLGAVFWQELLPDHGTLIANLVRWSLGQPERVTVHGAGMFDIATWEGPTGFAVVLVNLTNPMAMRGPIRETLPAGPLEVRVRVPDDCALEGIDLLVAGASADWTRHDSTVTVVVPRIELLETVHLRWARGAGR
ncbi:MAG TPA: alpha-amylase family protein [Pseudolysinimonas sp.]|nr:alpha-amylase family protein [Pseudolysinimonas sp.]